MGPSLSGDAGEGKGSEGPEVRQGWAHAPLSLAAARFAVRARVVVRGLRRRAGDGFHVASGAARRGGDLAVLRFDQAARRRITVQAGQGTGQHLAVRAARAVLIDDVEHDEAGGSPAFHRHGGYSPDCWGKALSWSGPSPGSVPAASPALRSAACSLRCCSLASFAAFLARSRSARWWL